MVVVAAIPKNLVGLAYYRESCLHEGLGTTNITTIVVVAAIPRSLVGLAYYRESYEYMIQWTVTSVTLYLPVP